MRVTSALQRLHADEQGAVVVITALMLVVLLGSAALVIDLGGSLSFRRQMVAATDSGALAAARACANGQTSSQAQGAADGFAAENAAGTVPSNRIRFEVTNTTTRTPAACGLLAPARGSVTVAYQRVRDNVFAPLVGYASTTVGATATASWGPLSSGIPPPVLLAQNPFAECFPEAVRRLAPASIEIEPRCVVWFNNEDVGNGQWGFMDLDTWGIARNAHCQGTAPPAQLRTWIQSGYPTPLTVDPVPTYVCLAPGTNPQGWIEDLHGERYQPGGKTGLRLFPVTDPDATVPGPGHPKVGVIGFAMVRIRFADWGPGTRPSGGQTYTCKSSDMTLTTTQVVVLDSGTIDGANCPSGPASVATIVGEPKVTYKRARGRSEQAVKCLSPGIPAGCHYTYDVTTRTLTWHAPDQEQVAIEFTWTTPLVAGSCPTEAPGAPHLPPPGSSAAVACVVISWPGPQTASGFIGGTNDFGARAVDLTG